MHFFETRIRRSWLLAVVGIAALTGAFAYGVLVGNRYVFPYTLVRSAYRALFPSGDPLPVGPGNEIVGTSLVALQKMSFNYSNPLDLAGNGGGIAKLGNSAIGVDSDGQFFLYSKSGTIQRLEISIPTNEDLLSQYVSRRVRASIDQKDILEMFRVLDIATKEGGQKVEIFVSHNYWHPQKLSKTIRLSRVIVDSVPDLVAGRSSIQADQWETIYETQPSLSMATENCTLLATENCTRRGESCRAERTFSR